MYKSDVGCNLYHLHIFLLKYCMSTKENEFGFDLVGTKNPQTQQQQQ